MRTKQFCCLLSFVLGVFFLFSFNAQAKTPQPAYRVNIALPSNWKMVSNEKYTGGYVQIYIPSSSSNNFHEQNLAINYGHKLNTSLKQAKQEVESVVAETDCRIRHVKVISEKQNSIIFTTNLDQCKNGKSLRQIFNIFNTSDGQYAILYTAGPDYVSQKLIRTMQDIVKEATISRVS